MILEILQAFLGLSFALFIPGFLMVLLLFDEFKLLEKLVFAVAFSIMLDVFIGIFFGYNEAQALRTGGLTLMNIIYAELVINAILLIAVLWKYYWKGIPAK